MRSKACQFHLQNTSRLAMLPTAWPPPACPPPLQPLTPTAGPSMDLPASASQVPHPLPGRWLPHQIMSFLCPKTLKWLPVSLRVEVKVLLTSCKACVICLYPLFPDLISQYSPPQQRSPSHITDSLPVFSNTVVPQGLCTAIPLSTGLYPRHLGGMLPNLPQVFI